MSYLRFIILTALSTVVALCILLQIVLVRAVQADDLRLKQTEADLQQGQGCFTRLQQIATRVGQVAQQQQDQGLKDLLARQNIQIRAPAPAPAPAPTTPSAPSASSTH
jgi:hypothetical protein